MTRSLHSLLRLGVAGLLTAAPIGLRAATPAPIPDDPLHLSATLATPTSIRIEWQAPTTPPAGYAIEWTAQPKDGYVVIEFLPAHALAHVHADLMPDSRNHYRIRAIHGPASMPVTVTLPDTLSDAEHLRRYEAPEDFRWAVPKRLRQAGPKVTASIKGTEAAPTALHAVLMPVTASGFRLSWRDNSVDESGFLVEMKKAGDGEFRVVAMVDADINSLGYALEPPTRSAEFRVRAYRYGKVSNTVMQVTGRELADGSNAAERK